ncbi:MAG TPA: class I SAM-dependent methyltransferase [Acidobacteriota bacterium]|nr:class I SAM-dependent methyltransferase [Acidobacteriota bacterium]
MTADHDPKRDPAPAPPPEVLAYYDTFPEETRLAAGRSRLEFERSKEILLRALPKPPARVLDVGGGGGIYSAWLAGEGYDAHLVDASPRLVALARKQDATRAKPIASFHVADARRLPQPDGFADAVLVMGPLYHLQEGADRAAALREAYRVLARGGVVAAAAISRFAPTLDGMASGYARDPRFVAIRDRGLRDGRHMNDTATTDYFTTAYLHRPEELRGELASAGFGSVFVLGIEGPAWIVPDFEARWKDEAQREDLLHVARVLESEPAIVGASAHLMAIGRKP